LRSHEALVTDVRLKRAGIRRTGLSSWKTVPLFEIQGATNRREILEFLIKRSAIPTFGLQWAISDSIIPLPDSTLRRLNLGEVGDDLLLRALEFYHGIASIDDSEGVLIATSRISREAVISAGRAAGERIGIPLTSDDAPQTNR